MLYKSEILNNMKFKKKCIKENSLQVLYVLNYELFGGRLNHSSTKNF